MPACEEINSSKEQFTNVNYITSEHREDTYARDAKDTLKVILYIRVKKSHYTSGQHKRST